MISIWHWILQVTGTANESGKWYAFWSGFGADLTEFAILGSLFGLYRHHKCTTCARLGRHPVEGTPYITCHKHATLEHHEQLHRRHKERYPAQHAFLNRMRNRDPGQAARDPSDAAAPA